MIGGRCLQQAGRHAAQQSQRTVVSRPSTQAWTTSPLRRRLWRARSSACPRRPQSLVAQAEMADATARHCYGPAN